MNGNRTTPSNLDARVRHQLAEADPNAAATTVLEALGPGVLRYLGSILPQDDARDAFSEFQICAWRGLPGFRWECSLRAWAYRLAWHAAVRCMRDGYRRRRVSLPEDLMDLTPPPGSSADWLEGRSQQLARLQGELAREDQVLLDLRLGRSLPWEDVAAALSAEGRRVKPAALRKRFERLREKLTTLARARGLVA